MNTERLISRLKNSKELVNKYDGMISVIKKILTAQVQDRNKETINSIIDLFEEEANYELSKFLKEMQLIIEELEKTKEVKHE